MNIVGNLHSKKSILCVCFGENIVNLKVVSVDVLIDKIANLILYDLNKQMKPHNTI